MKWRFVLGGLPLKVGAVLVAMLVLVSLAVLTYAQPGGSQGLSGEAWLSLDQRAQRLYVMGAVDMLYFESSVRPESYRVVCFRPGGRLSSATTEDLRRLVESFVLTHRAAAWGPMVILVGAAIQTACS